MSVTTGQRSAKHGRALMALTSAASALEQACSILKLGTLDELTRVGGEI